MHKKNFNEPDDVKTPPKSKHETIDIAGKTIIRSTFQPGWKWSVDIGPAAGSDRCQMHHVLCGLSGTIKAVAADGTEIEVGPGDVADIPPGHDAWVIGDVPFVAIDIGANS